MSVPFGKRKIVGVVIKNIQKQDFLKKAGAIKKIIAVLDEYPLFDKPIFLLLIFLNSVGIKVLKTSPIG